MPCSADCAKARRLFWHGFRDTTRLASGSPAMWRDIAMDNAPAIEQAIDDLQAELATLKTALNARAAALKRFLPRAVNFASNGPVWRTGSASNGLARPYRDCALPGPVLAHITVPGSKSITNRALILAALAEGDTTLTGALWSEDTQIMVGALQTMGFGVMVAEDPAESGNRTITVQGQGGRIPKTPEDLFVGNAGTAARFLAALVCLGDGPVKLHGIDRMHERPQGELFQALRALGYTVDAPNNKLPATIHGTGPRAACAVSLQESSLFASALLLAAGVGGWQIGLGEAKLDEAPYVQMTQELIAEFPRAAARLPLSRMLRAVVIFGA